MRTKPAKLLMALLLGMGSLAIVSTPAFADDSKDSKDSKDSSSVTGCTGKVIYDCGVKFVLTTCNGSSIASTSKDKDGKDESDDDKHESKDKTSDKDKDGKDKAGTAKNDHDRNEDTHRDHLDRSAGSEHQEGDGKIAICHRMGGAETSLVVANDGKLSGHSKHALDTVERCEDFHARKDDDDSKEDKDKDHKISASDVGYSIGITTTQVACLNEYNTGNSTISIQPTNQGPSRGGVRTLH